MGGRFSFRLRRVFERLMEIQTILSRDESVFSAFLPMLYFAQNPLFSGDRESRIICMVILPSKTLWSYLQNCVKQGGSIL